MKAVLVPGAGQAPVYGDFPEPVPEAGEARIAVSATALSPAVRGRAAGTHYSASGRFPFVAGIDGVGRLDDGRRVYFGLPRAPYGSMAERTVAPAAWCLPLPGDLDDVTAAAIANPGMSSWAALSLRARLRAGETVLVNGATGAAGRLAVPIARHLGAARVIATGRNVAALGSLGADETIVLGENDEALDKRFRNAFAEGVDVVIDYLWGSSAERLIVAAARTGREGRPLRFVQVGSASGADITLPGAALRAAAIELSGSGFGSVPLDNFVHSVGALLAVAGPAGLDIATRPVPLAEAGREWARSGESAVRTVFTVDAAA